MREIPAESPSLGAAAGAELSAAISLFSSSISLMAFSCRPIRTFSPDSLCPLLDILACSNFTNWRAEALLRRCESSALECRYFLALRRSPRRGPDFYWAALILSHQRCGNRLPTSTGGAQVTPSFPCSEYPARANIPFGYAGRASSVKATPRNHLGSGSVLVPELLNICPLHSNGGNRYDANREIHPGDPRDGAEVAFPSRAAVLPGHPRCQLGHGFTRHLSIKFAGA